MFSGPIRVVLTRSNIAVRIILGKASALILSTAFVRGGPEEASAQKGKEGVEVARSFRERPDRAGLSECFSFIRWEAEGR